MIAKSSFLFECEAKGATWIYDPAIECLSIIAGNGMCHSGIIRPFDGRTNSNGD